MPHLKRRREIETRGLLLDRVDDFPARMSSVDTPQAGDAIQHLTPVVSREMHVLGGNQQSRLRFELAIGRERHPEGLDVEMVRAHRFILPRPRLFGYHECRHLHINYYD